MKQQRTDPIIMDELCRSIAARASVTEQQAREFVDKLFTFIIGRLRASGVAQVQGLGTFRSDADGAVTFTPDTELSHAVNEPFLLFDPIPLSDAEVEALSCAETEDEDETSAKIQKPAPELKPEPEQKPAPMPAPVYVPVAAPEQPAPVADLPPDPPEQQEMVQPQAAQPAQAASQTPLPLAQPRKAYRFGWFAAGVVTGALMGWMATALYYNGVFDSADEDYIMADEITAEEMAPRPDTAADTAITEPEPTPYLRTDTVSTSRYITHMAADYYGNRLFWVYIYEANAERLGHPERTLPGTVVLIPDPSTIPVNPHSEADLKAARRLAAEIYGRFN